MNWLKKIWHDPVGSKVISFGLIAVIVAGYTTAKGAWLSVWAAIVKGFWWFFETSAIYNWFWLLWAALTIFVARKIAIAFFEGRSAETVSLTEYDQEVFFDVQWRWGYADSEIINLTSYCKKCDYQILGTRHNLLGMEEGVKYMCEDCGYESEVIEGTRSQIENRVLRYIHKRLRNGTWRDIVIEKLAEQGDP